MSDYKIVKDKDGNLICYGPNNEGYEPNVKAGETLTLESAEIAEPLIKAFNDKQSENAQKAIDSAKSKLAALGLTTDDLKALGL
jgi:hypothetical protein